MYRHENLCLLYCDVSIDVIGQYQAATREVVAAWWPESELANAIPALNSALVLELFWRAPLRCPRGWMACLP